MPLSLPNLDDRRYDDLVAEALRIIPSFAPEWTNHNSSDPGITLVELLAYVTELLVYRTNRITDRHLAAFVALATGRPAVEKIGLQQQMHAAALALRETQRAITAGDFEKLACEALPGIARAHCIPGRDARGRERAGHVSVVVVPEAKDNEVAPAPDAGMLAAVRAYMEPARLVTTRLHIVGPRYQGVRVSAEVVLKPDARWEKVRHSIEQALEGLLKTWRFGHPVYTSDVHRVIEQQRGVDAVAAVGLGPADHPVSAIALDPDQLPVLEIGSLRPLRTRDKGE